MKHIITTLAFVIVVQDPPNNFFLKLEKTAEYLLKFIFLFESTILPVNNRK